MPDEMTTMGARRAHALHNYSAAAIWLHCDLYYAHKLEAEAAGEDYDRSGAAAERGHLMHEVAEVVLPKLLATERNPIRKLVREYFYDEVPESRTARYTLDELDLMVEDTAAAVDAAHDEYLRASEQYGVADLYTEYPVPLPHEPVQVGRVDVLIHAGPELIVLDYKFGEGLIEPDSEQLKGYAGAAVLHWVEFLEYVVEKVTTVVVQPRNEAEPVRSRTMTADEAAQFQHHVNHVTAHQRRAAAEGVGLRGAAEPYTCEWCPFKGRCGHRDVLIAGLAVPERKLSPRQIERVVENRKAIEEWLKECAARVADDPETFPDWKRIQVSNGRAWSPALSEAELALLLLKAGAPGEAVYTVRSPAQVRDRNKGNDTVQRALEEATVEKGHHTRLSRIKSKR